jgi:hypothetical protein
MLAASFAHVSAALWRGAPDSPEGLDGFPPVSDIVTITTVYHLAQQDQWQQWKLLSSRNLFGVSVLIAL